MNLAITRLEHQELSPEVILQYLLLVRLGCLEFLQFVIVPLVKLVQFDLLVSYVLRGIKLNKIPAHDY
jgi:hypothetical protein